MTRGEIWKDFFKKTVLTVLIAGVLFYWAAAGIHKGRGNELLLCVAVLRHPLWHTPYVRMAYPTRLRPFRHGGRRCAQLYCGRLDWRRHSDMAACGRGMVYPTDDISASKRRQGRRSRNQRGISKKRERGAAADDGHRAPSFRGCCFKCLLRSRTLFLRV